MRTLEDRFNYIYATVAGQGNVGSLRAIRHHCRLPQDTGGSDTVQYSLSYASEIQLLRHFAEGSSVTPIF